MKGFIFTTDMIIGLSLAIIIILAFVSLEFESTFPEKRYERLNYVADDVVNLLSNLKVRSISNKPTISKLVQNKVLNEEDMNKTVLDMIGSFWYGGNESIAENISREVLEPFNDTCINLTAEWQTIYSSCIITSQNIAVRSRIASGYEIGRPVSGYIARALATKVTKNTTETFSIPMEGSSHGAGQRVFINKKFYVSATEILHATLYISIHWGTSNIESDEFKLNGNILEVGDPWVYYEQKLYGGKTTQLGFDVINVTNFVKSGWNELYIMLKTSSEHHAHIHPGSRVEVIYKVNETNFTLENKKKFYFSNIKSEGSVAINKQSGAWSIMPIYIPNGATVKNVTLHLKGVNITDSPNKDIQIYLNNATVLQADPVGSSFETTINLTSNVTYGNNVLAVYLNSFINESGADSDFWGTEDVGIYSDPQNDPESSSYVYFEFEPSAEAFRYGFIDITKSEQMGGIRENPKSYSKYFQNINLLEAFAQVSQLDSLNVTVKAYPQGSPPNLAFQSQRTFNTPTDILIDSSYLKSLSTNFVDISDTCTEKCDILPESSFQYTIMVPSNVGYGNVFYNVNDAVDDAKQRLLNLMNSYGIAVSEENIGFNNRSVQGIKWLWGPSLFKILAWEK